MTSTAFDPAIDELIIAKPRKEIVFIEDNVADYQTIAANAGAGCQVIILDSSKDGLRQIADAVKGMSGIDALHVVTHGAEGRIGLGTLSLDAASAAEHKDVLAAIGGSMSADGDMLFYGCSVGAGQGADLVSQLAIATGADVAASNNPTGDATLGGDWNLEVAAGSIETPVLVDAALAAQYHQLLGVGKTINFDPAVTDYSYGVQYPDATPNNDLTYVIGGPTSIKFNGQSEGVGAYDTGYITFAALSKETQITISLTDGQVFTPTFVDLNKNASTEQTLVFTGLNGSGATIASQEVTVDTLAFSPKMLSGFTDIKTLVITAKTGFIQYFQMDTLVLSSIGDSTPPTLAITSNKSTVIAGDTAAITFTFSEDPGASFTGADIAVSGGTLGALSGSGMTRTATFTPSAGVNSGTATISVATNKYADAASNFNTSSSSLSLTVDTVAPTVAITSDPSILKGGDTAAITFTFSEDPGSSFSAADVVVSNGSIGAITGSGMTRNATLTPSAGLNGASVSITVNDKSYADAAGNLGAAGASPSITVDNVAPGAPTTPVLDPSTDKGASNSDNVTSWTTLQFTGSAEAGVTTVKLFDGSTQIGSGAVSTGPYSITTSPLAPGVHTITARGYDAAGNESVASGSVNVTVDTSAPTVSISSDPSTLLAIGGTADITFTFSDDPGSTFSWDGSAGDVIVSGGTLSAITGTGATRHATFTPTANTDAGTASIRILSGSYADLAGNNGTGSNILSLSYDTKAPNVPSAPSLAVGDDAGASNSDYITNKDPLTFSGTADTGTTVKLYDGATLVGSVTASGGTYTIPVAGLGEGNHALTAIAVDAAGNTSAASSGLAVSIDRTPPSTTIASAALSSDSGNSNSDMITKIAGQTISGTLSANLAAGERVMVSLDNGASWTPATASVGANTWELANVTLAGSNTLKVKVEDLAGNGGTVYSHAYTLDQVGPSAPSTPDLDAGSDSGSSNTDNITGVTVPSFSGTADVGAIVKLFDGGIEIGSVVAVDGTWHITTGNGWTMDPRVHYITAEASDLAGNAVGSSALEVTVRAAPSTSIASIALSSDNGVAGDFITNAPTQTISGLLSANLATGERVQVSLNGGASWNDATATVGSKGWSIPATLSAGAHDIKVRVTNDVDASGPVLTQAYTLDSAKPAVTITSDVAQLKAGDTANITFTFSDDPGTSFDSSDISVSGGTLSALSGTGTTRTAVFTPTAGVNGGTASIGIDAGNYEDLAGNTGLAGSSPSLSFDTLAPVAPSAPDLDADSDKGAASTDNLTNLTSLVFKGTAEAGSTVKLYDSDGSTEIGSATATGGNWTITTSTLGQGSHSVTAKAFDAAGNAGAASGATTVTIDTAKPTLSISSDVSQLKSGETALVTFTFSEDPGATFSWNGTAGDVTVSGGTLSALQGSGTVRTATFTPAANTNGGTASISVLAGSYQDAAGNDGSAGATPSLQVDTLAPGAPSTPVLLFDNGTSSHDGVINLPDPLFTGSAEAGTTVTLYDADTGNVLGASTAAGGTWNILSTALTEGEHRIYAVARDAAGNASPASASATVIYDKTPPTVTVSSNVSTLKTGETALITFVFSEDPAGFFSLANLTNAAGTFSDLAGTGLTRTAVFTPNANHEGSVVNVGTGILTDVAGNSDLGGSVPIFIDTKAPASPGAPRLAVDSDTGSSSTDGITNDATPTLRGFKELNATVTLYDSDGTVLGTSSDASAAWTITTGALSDGVHTITATQTDSVGNVGILSAGLVITVDTSAAAPVAPVLDPSSDSAAKGDALTGDTTPTITGSAEAGASVTLYDSDGSTVLGTATADGSGAWSITSSALSAGSHALSARQVDVAGNVSGASPVLVLNIDDAAPALAAPALAGASDSGTAGDGVTRVAAPSFSGSAEALAQVTLYDGATVIGSVQADAGGAWQITASALADGVHAISARQVDRAGNQSDAGAVFSLTVDTVAPAAPAAPTLQAASDTGAKGDGMTENSLPVVEGTALANSLVTLYDTVGATRVKVGTALADGSGKWSIASSLAIGQHSLSSTQSDAAGNESAASAPFKLLVVAPPVPVNLIDGVPVDIQPISLPGGVSGSAVSIPVVSAGRAESTGHPNVADIPLATSSQGGNLLLAQLAPGYGLSASGASVPAANAGALLIAAIKAATPSHGAADQGHLTGNGQSFLDGLASAGSLLVETVKPVSSGTPDGLLTLSGPAAGTGQSTALVIDAGGMANGTIALQQVDFAAVIGAAKVVAGSGMVLTGDAASQQFTVAAGGSGSVFAGGGNDTLGIAAPAAAGPVPGAGLALLHGGAASDVASFGGARADYTLEVHNGYVIVSSKSAPEVKAMVVNVEQLQFSDGSVAVQNNADMGTLAGMYQTVLGRQADVMGIEYWANVHQAGASWGAIALGMIASSEHVASRDGFNGVAAHDIGLLYTAIFNREADAGGMAYWTAAMQRGVTLEQVASSFVQSVEMVGHQRAATDWDFIIG